VQTERNVKWVLVISLIMFSFFAWPFSGFLFIGSLFSLPFYHLPPNYTLIEFVWYVINHADLPLFLLTITFATLFMSGFGRKELLYRLSIYSFALSMAFLFITFLQMLFGLPYRY
jgi:hypothetical protein